VTAYDYLSANLKKLKNGKNTKFQICNLACSPYKRFTKIIIAQKITCTVSEKVFVPTKKKQQNNKTKNKKEYK
jgi:hypothetical protein